MLSIQTASKQKPVEFLTEKITKYISSNTPVLFLVSGGSAASIAVDICSNIRKTLTKNNKSIKWLLNISLIDERYGDVGHSDSNWRVLSELGLEHESFSTIPILHLSAKNITENIDLTVEKYNAFLEHAVTKHIEGSLRIIGLFGIGADGHTAGILPDSPSTDFCKQGQYALSYKSALFTRITISPLFFNHIDLAVAWVSGEAKREVIETLITPLDFTKQPAQLLKNAKETIVFTDLLLGEHS